MSEECVESWALATWTEELRERAESAADYADAWCLLGQALAAGGRDGEAATAFEHALDINPNFRDAVIGLAFARGEIGSAARGFAVFRRLGGHASTDLAVPFAIGVFAMRHGWTDVGVEQLRVATRLGAGLPYLHLHLATALRPIDVEVAAATHDEGAELAVAFGVGPRGNVTLREVDEWLPPGDVPVRVAQAWRALRAGDRDAATRILGDARARWPGHELLSMASGRLAAAFDEFEEAENAFRSALHADPGHHEARVELALLCARTDRTGEAVEHLRAAVQERPTFPDYRYQLGLALRDLGRSAEAAVEFERSLALEPRHGACALQLAEAWLEDGRADEALQILEAGAWRDWPEACSLQARAQALRGDFDAARELVERALRTDPGDETADSVRRQLDDGGAD